MMQSYLQHCLFLGSLLMPVLQGCSHLSGKADKKIHPDISVTGWVCEAFIPIDPQAMDSQQTILQIAEHNAAWQAVCE